MNILITGSSGYIGNNFIKTFTGKYNFVKFSLLQDTLDNLELSHIDSVLHCAALVHQKTAYDYQKYDDINVQYPIALAKKAKESGVKQFIFISTIAVYGEGETKLNETTVCQALTPYGKSKLEAEKQLEELKNENFIVSIIRPPMVYGKDAPGNMSSLVKLIKKVPILPFAKIDNKRSFIYIDNLTYLINRVIEQNKSGIFLASDDEPLSTTKLIELIKKELDRTIYLVQIPFFEPLLKSFKPSLHKRLYESLEIDNTMTREILNIKNPFSVSHGIKDMLSGEQK